jgi:hypothetical protein
MAAAGIQLPLGPLHPAVRRRTAIGDRVPNHVLD